MPATDSQQFEQPMTDHLTNTRQSIEQSPGDQRQYRHLRLDNGLKILVASDPHAVHSAAALAIDAGHFQDPVSAQGLAHFLEHMIFMGNRQFPGPHQFPEFVTTHGGEHNAWTGTEHTNFYFDIRPDAFSQGLSHFSALFTCPLFDREWIAKELQAVESEYRMKLTDELRRLYQVHKETANPAHPFTKFSVGNEQTLCDGDPAELEHALREFFQTWYVASNMSLVLIGPQSLAELELLANTHFTQLNSGQAPHVPVEQPLYLPEQQGVIIHVRPLKQACRMILTLPLPGINDDYPYKSTTLLAHLLGDEGPDSLCAALKQQGWATDLSAGGGVSGSNFKDFNFNIQLTENGLAHYEDVAALIFATIRQLSEQPLAGFYYQERQRMVALAYRYQESVRTLDYATQLSINMLHYRPEHVISGDYLMQEMNHAKLTQLLDCMRPENARLVLIHHSLPVNQTTTLYETAYKIKPLRPEQLKHLKQSKADHIRLPQPNPFIPQRLAPLPLRQPVRRLPQLLGSVPALQCWHLQDADFHVPKGHLYLSLMLPQATHSKTAFTHARVWCELVLDKLNERCYDAEVAGIHFNLYPQQSGISLHISGFSERQADLLARVLHELTDFSFDPQRFSQIQHNLYHNWQAVNRHKPINHLFTVLNQQLQRGCYIGRELADELQAIDANSFRQQMPGIFAQMNVNMLIHGDWPVNDAKQLATMVSRELGLSNRPQQGPLREVRLLDIGREHWVECQLPHPDHALVYFCQGQSLSEHERAGFLLLNYLVSPGFFAALRTEQQLGYLVGTSYVPMNGRPGLLFYVQSPHAEIAQLEQAIRGFIHDFCQQLIDIPTALWEGARASVIGQLTDPDPSLRVRAQRLWTSIGIDDTSFDLAKRMATAVEQFDLESLAEMASHRLLTHAAAMWLSCKPEQPAQPE